MTQCRETSCAGTVASLHDVLEHQLPRGRVLGLRIIEPLADLAGRGEHTVTALRTSAPWAEALEG